MKNGETIICATFALQGMCAVAGLLSPQAHFAARLVAQGSDGAINHLVDHDYSEGSDSLPVAFLAECALAAAAADAMTGVPAEKVRVRVSLLVWKSPPPGQSFADALCLLSVSIISCH